MSLQRIRRYPYPLHVRETEDTRPIIEYLRLLYQELQDESATRIQDFRTEHIHTTVKARAYLSDNQENLVNNTWTKVLLDGETYDTGGNFASYKFTAPVAGFYMVTACVTFYSVVADKLYLSAIYNNGASIRIERRHSSPALSLSVPVSDIIELAVDDYLELYAQAYDVGGDTVDITGTTKETFMAVHLLSI